MRHHTLSDHAQETGDHQPTRPAPAPESFPPELLEQSASARLAYFEHGYILEHQRLLNQRDAVLHHLSPPDPDASSHRRAKMVLVIGPARVGKTTLIGLVEEALLQRAQGRMHQDPGYVPLVRITLDAKSRFDWRGYYLAILRALDDPFLEVRKPVTERTLQQAMEAALFHRQVEVVIVDEAQHLAKAAGGRTQQDQLDQLKYFENKLGLSHVLVGTYEMRPFRRVNAQLALRTVDVHFSRYDAREEEDRRCFLSALWAFQRQLPMPEEPPLVQKHWQWLFARSLGCIGLLKQHLDDALALALREGTPTVTEEQLRRTRLTKDKLELALKAILLGEEDFAKAEPKQADESLLISLGLLTPPAPLKQQEGPVQESAEEPSKRPALPPARNVRRPGERKPGRDALGRPAGRKVPEAAPEAEEAAG